jgi:transposase InsO family protein
MTMAYTTNEQVGKVRIAAIRMMASGKSSREAARHFGYNQSTMVRWYARRNEVWHQQSLPTRSSRPHTSPRRTAKEIEGLIIAKRKTTKRCAEVVHQHLHRDGIAVSVSTVKRVLNRYGLLKKRSPWKKTRKYPIRPDIATQGDLVEFDTIHLVDKLGKRSYVYTAIDVFSRYGFAMLSKRATAARTVSFLKECRKYFPFEIKIIQTDNGSEFGKYFTDHCGVPHRHNHPHSPNENAHLERFNRTIQEEMPRHGLCLTLKNDVSEYLKHYNHERLHMGIEYKTPKEMLR